MRLSISLAVVALVACADEQAPPPSPNPVPPLNCDCASQSLPGVCLPSDADHPSNIPAHTESVRCDSGTSSTPLFAVQSNLHPDFAAVHELCQSLDPAPHTDDADRHADIRALLVELVDRPALSRVLADLPVDERLLLLDETWLEAFEHILCGEANSDGTLGGQHLWSEFYFAEQAGDADYLCSVEGLGDPDIATVRYEWRAGPGSPYLSKSTGGFHVGMSPACMLAVGVLARRCGCPTSATVRATFRAEIYGSWVDWVMWNDIAGNLDTLFPIADDSPGAL